MKTIETSNSYRSSQARASVITSVISSVDGKFASRSSSVAVFQVYTMRVDARI